MALIIPSKIKGEKPRTVEAIKRPKAVEPVKPPEEEKPSFWKAEIAEPAGAVLSKLGKELMEIREKATETLEGKGPFAREVGEAVGKFAEFVAPAYEKIGITPKTLEKIGITPKRVELAAGGYLSGVTGGILKPETTAPKDVGDKVARAIGEVAGVVPALMTIGGGIAKAGMSVPRLTAFISKHPKLWRYLAGIGAFTAYGQIDPDLGKDAGARIRTFGQDVVTGALFTRLGGIRNVAKSVPAAFGLGFGLSKLSGGSNEDAIISGGVLAGLDLAMRAGGKGIHFVRGKDADRILTEEAKETLGIKDKKFTTQDLKKTRDKLAHKYHPDISKDPQAGKKMAAINNAYDVLESKAIKSEKETIKPAPEKIEVAKEAPRAEVPAKPKALPEAFREIVVPPKEKPAAPPPPAKPPEVKPAEVRPEAVSEVKPVAEELKPLAEIAKRHETSAGFRAEIREAVESKDRTAEQQRLVDLITRLNSSPETTYSKPAIENFWEAARVEKPEVKPAEPEEVEVTEEIKELLEAEPVPEEARAPAKPAPPPAPPEEITVETLTEAGVERAMAEQFIREAKEYDNYEDFAKKSGVMTFLPDYDHRMINEAFGSPRRLWEAIRRPEEEVLEEAPELTTKARKELGIKKPAPEAPKAPEEVMAKLEEAVKPKMYGSLREAREKLKGEGAISIYEQPLNQEGYVVYKILKGEPIPEELNYLATEMLNQGVLEQVEPGKGTPIDTTGMFFLTAEEARKSQIRHFRFDSEYMDMESIKEQFPGFDEYQNVKDWEKLQSGPGVQTSLEKGDIIKSMEIPATKLITRGKKKGQVAQIPGLGIVEDIYDYGQALVTTEKGIQQVDFYGLGEALEYKNLEEAEKGIVDRLKEIRLKPAEKILKPEVKPAVKPPAKPAAAKTTPALNLRTGDKVEVYNEAGRFIRIGEVQKVGEDFVIVKDDVTGLPIKHNFNFEFRKIKVEAAEEVVPKPEFVKKLAKAVEKPIPKEVFEIKEIDDNAKKLLEQAKGKFGPEFDPEETVKTAGRISILNEHSKIQIDDMAEALSYKGSLRNWLKELYEDRLPEITTAEEFERQITKSEYLDRGAEVFTAPHLKKVLTPLAREYLRKYKTATVSQIRKMQEVYVNKTLRALKEGVPELEPEEAVAEPEPPEKPEEYITEEVELTAKGRRVMGKPAKVKPARVKATPEEKIKETLFRDFFKPITKEEKRLPILGRIAVDGNKFIATDLEKALVYTADKDTGVKATIHIKEFQLPETKRWLKPEEITNDMASRVGESMQEFPLLPEIEKPKVETSFSLPPEILKKAISSVAKDIPRPELNGIHFKTTPEGLVIVSTDSFRLWQNTLTGKPAKEFSFIFPGESAKLLVKILDKVRPDQIKIRADEQNVEIEFGKFKFLSRLVQGDFPDYKPIIPDKPQAVSFEAERLEFLDVIREAKPYVGRTNEVRLIPDKKKSIVKIQARRPPQEPEGKVEVFEKEIPAEIRENVNPPAKAEDMILIMPIKSDTEAVEKGEGLFNRNYLEDFLKNAEAEKIRGMLDDPQTSPGVFQEVKTPEGMKIIRDLGKAVYIPKVKEEPAKYLDLPKRNDIKRYAEEFPDVDNPDEMSLWRGPKETPVYMEGWCNKCFAGTGIGKYETQAKINYAKDLTKEILERKGRERGLRLVEGGFKETPDKDFVVGVSWGIYVPAELPFGRKASFVTLRLRDKGFFYARNERVQGPDDIADMMREVKNIDREKFFVINLDKNNKIINVENLYTGTINASLVHPEEVVKSITLSNAKKVYTLHNHPSGDPEPSADDLSINERVEKVIKRMGVKNLGHIVMNTAEYGYIYPTDVSPRDMKGWIKKPMPPEAKERVKIKMIEVEQKIKDLPGQLNRIIDSDFAAADVASLILNKEVPAILSINLNSRNKINGVNVISLSIRNPEKVADKVIKNASLNNAVSVVLATNLTLDETAAGRKNTASFWAIKKRLDTAGINLTDVVGIRPTTISLKRRGELEPAFYKEGAAAKPKFFGFLGEKKADYEALSPEEKEVIDILEKGEKIPKRLAGAVDKLRGRGYLKKKGEAEKPGEKFVKYLGQGFATPEIVRKIQTVMEEKGISQQAKNIIKKGFTGSKGVKDWQLTQFQADQLYTELLELTPDSEGKVRRLIDQETKEIMKDFIPPKLLERKGISRGDVEMVAGEEDINYLVSLFRPVRKVLTSGEITPDQTKVGERIYDMVSEAQENKNIDYRNWHRKYVELYKEARKEDKDVDANVFGYIEQGWEVPAKTQKLAEFLKGFYSDSVPVMKPQALRKRYITHTPRTFMERVKSQGLIKALKEVVVPNIAPQENISPDIELALDYIVSKEKFNPFALPREEYAKYSRQLQKTVEAYASLYFYKKHFDPIMPKVLRMKSFLPPGKQKYVRKWLQTIGGRPLDYWIWRGKPMRIGRRVINSAVRFEYATLLGLNVSSGLGNAAGGNWNNIADIPKDRLALGNKRLFTKQGRKFIDKYGLAEQTLYLEPVGGRLENLTKAERALFVFMQMGEFQMRGSAALSVIPESEFQSGELSSETRAKIRRQTARTQGLFGPAQAPLITQTTVGRPFAMFKHWMINEMELWHSFVRESAKRIKERPDLYKNPIKNPGMKRILKYVLIGIVFATFSPSFFKKEVWQKMGIPVSLLKTAFDRADAPLVQDVMFVGAWLNHFVRGEVEESKDEFVRWFKNISPEAKKALESAMGEIKTSRGALVRKMSLAERFKHLLFGRYTKEGQKSQELDEMIDEIWPTEFHYKYSFITGTSRQVKTKYQAVKEKIIAEIERKKYRNIDQVEKDEELVGWKKDYNKRAKEQLDKWVEETEKFYKVKITDKNYNSKLKRVTIQPDNVESWMEAKIKKETVPAALRR